MEGSFSEVPGLESRDSTKEPRCLACLRTPTKGRTQSGQLHGSKEQSSHEQKAVHRADGRAHRLAKGRSQKTPGSFHDDRVRSAQGGRGGPAAWLREVLHQGAEGEGG